MRGQRPGGLAALAAARGLPLEQVLRAVEDDDAPGSHLVDLAALDRLRVAGGPAGWVLLEDGTVAGPESARRLSCDADVLPVVLAGGSEALDVGRATRTWPLAVRRAAWARAGAVCEVPGCSNRHSDLHHRRHWSQGGSTSLDNAVFLCAFHHWLVHHHDWDVVPDAAGGHLLVRTGGSTGVPPPRRP